MFVRRLCTTPRGGRHQLDRRDRTRPGAAPRAPARTSEPDRNSLAPVGTACMAFGGSRRFRREEWSASKRASSKVSRPLDNVTEMFLGDPAAPEAMVTNGSDAHAPVSAPPAQAAWKKRARPALPPQCIQHRCTSSGTMPHPTATRQTSAPGRREPRWLPTHTEASRTHPTPSRRRPANSAAPPLDRRAGGTAVQHLPLLECFDSALMRSASRRDRQTDRPTGAAVPWGR